MDENESGEPVDLTVVPREKMPVATYTPEQFWKKFWKAFQSISALFVAGWLFDLALEWTGMKPNIIMACLAWAAILACVLRVFWINARWTRKWKLGVVIWVPLTLGIVFAPWVVAAYKEQNQTALVEADNSLIIDLRTAPGSITKLPERWGGISLEVGRQRVEDGVVIQEMFIDSPSIKIRPKDSKYLVEWNNPIRVRGAVWGVPFDGRLAVEFSLRKNSLFEVSLTEGAYGINVEDIRADRLKLRLTLLPSGPSLR